MGIPHFTMLQKRANCQLFVTSSAVKGLRTKTPRIVVEIPLYIMLQNLVTTLCASKMFLFSFSDSTLSTFTLYEMECSNVKLNNECIYP